MLEDTAIAGGGAFARDVARGVDASWVRNLYRFAVRPTIGFYFRISVEEALRRVVGNRDAISYYEAGMDHTHIDDTEESFRVFQSCVIDEYDSMVDEFGLVVIDARQSIEDQQVQMREAAAQTLAGVPWRSEFPRELIVQDDAEEESVDLHAAVVLNEPEVPELVHEEVDARSRRPDHFSERFLGNLGYLPLRTNLIAVPRQQQKGSRQPLLAGVEEVIDQIRPSGISRLLPDRRRVGRARASSWPETRCCTTGVRLQTSTRSRWWPARGSSWPAPTDSQARQ